MNLPTAPKFTRRSRRKIIRSGIITGNIILLLAIGLFVLDNRSASSSVRSSTLISATSTTSSVTNPLDQLSADQIALEAAQMVKLPELTMVRNRADSAAILSSVVPNDNSTLAKPQVVTTAQKSRLDIIFYKVVRGDNVDKLARHFHVSAADIKSSNNLTGNTLTVGRNLVIPPGNGIVYRVSTSDTIDTIVNRFQANRSTFITVNDAESGNVQVGEYVWIPNGVRPVVNTTAAVSVAPLTTNLFSASTTGSYYYTGPCTPNGYDCGWCTRWVAHRRQQIGSPLPPNLGDAISWAASAEQHGIPVSFKPQAGAAVWFPGMDHVGYVESVKKDGSYVMSEMNAAGFKTVSFRTIPASQVGNYKYIY